MKHSARIVSILTELGIPLIHTPVLHVDNMACVQFLNGGNKAKDFIRDSILKGTISVKHEESDNKPADALTKVLEYEKFSAHMERIMGHNERTI